MNKKLYISPEIDIFAFNVEPMLAGTEPGEGGQIEEGLAELGLFDEEDKLETDSLDEAEDETTEGFTLPTFHSLWD